MASRYWVGGTGTWDATSTANWSATSGGAAGASAPTTADNVFFDASSGTGTVTLETGATAANATHGAANITLLLNANVTFVTGFTFNAGSLNLNGKTLTCALFQASVTNARTITSGNGIIETNRTTAGVAFNLATSNLTVDAPFTVNATGNATTGTREFYPGTLPEGSAPNINIQAGSDTILLGQTSNSINFTGFSGTWASAPRTLYGNLTLSSTMTMAASGNFTTFASTNSTPRILTTNGVLFDAFINVNGVGGTLQLGSALTIPSTKNITLTNGTFDAVSYSVSLGLFALGAGTKTLSLGTNTWTVTGSGLAWNANTNVSGLTVSASTATISMTNSSAKTFAGGAKSWPTLNQGGAGALTIQQSNTFANITSTTLPSTITLTAATTQSLTAFTLAGTAGNLVTLNSSSAGSRATIIPAVNVTNVSYVSFKDIAATTSAVFAYTFNGNVNGGNNTGIRFNLADISVLPCVAI